jgi:hypothetical protein
MAARISPRKITKPKPQPKPQPKPSVKESARTSTLLPQNTDRMIWDLYRDGLTQSMLNLFLQCPEQFYLSYVQGWTAKRSTFALSFGSCFHDMAAHLSVTTPNVQEVLESRHEKALRGDAKSNHRPLAGSELDSYLRESSLAAVVLEKYQQFWNKHEKGIVWVARERLINQPGEDPVIYYPPTGAPSVILNGRWDGLFRKPTKDSPGSLKGLETKTMSRIDEEGIGDRVPHDLQVMFYSLAARERFGEAPTGFVYDIVRRPGLKMGKDENEQQFLERVKADIEARPRWYFIRYPITFHPSDIDRWVKRQFSKYVFRISQWWDSVKALILSGKTRWESPYHYMNPYALENKYGQCSMFQPICNNDFSGHLLRDIINPELEEDA